MLFRFDNTYARLPERFCARVLPTPVAAPSLLALNRGLAGELGLPAEQLTSPEGVAVLAGNRIPEGAEPVACAYAGHQFGVFVPQLGDGRAILLGEIVGGDGRRRDVQLKGSGRTPFSRDGDGRAAVGPVLREYLVGETMHALGVPTTRALAAVRTGEEVFRQGPLPGAVLTRVASSHIRVGTFEYFAARGDREALSRLVAFALERHYPDAPRREGAALALFDAVAGAQADLVARWLALGFVHGVMNTDNMAVSGETIDYGPCAFLDAYDPLRTFSSIDRGGRYAFARQPDAALWNLARFAEALAALVDADPARADGILNERLAALPARLAAAYEAEILRKLGLGSPDDGALELARELLERMAADRVDYTLCFRRLSAAAAGAGDSEVADLFHSPAQFRKWAGRWHRRLSGEPGTPAEHAARMCRVNPAFIPRNHRVEQAIAAAEAGDMGPFERLSRVLARPYDDQPEASDLAEPPGPEQWSYRTFCGT
ncbi:MAG TPA: YdiU family protein [Planctomycetota bacterium]|nr:YdiU family protein [Planctomycetota bacterium]